MHLDFKCINFTSRKRSNSTEVHRLPNERLTTLPLGWRGYWFDLRISFVEWIWSSRTLMKMIVFFYHITSPHIFVIWSNFFWRVYRLPLFLSTTYENIYLLFSIHFYHSCFQRSAIPFLGEYSFSKKLCYFTFAKIREIMHTVKFFTF